MKDGGVNVAKEVVEIKVAQRVDYWFHKRQTWIPGNIIFLSILVDLTCSTDERLLCEKLFTGALANCTNTGWAAGDPLVLCQQVNTPRKRASFNKTSSF